MKHTTKRLWALEDKLANTQYALALLAYLCVVGWIVGFALLRELLR
jgi:hypothetical protein